MAKKYYRLDRIKKEKAQYNIIFGPNSNGKSFAVKEELIKDTYKSIGPETVLQKDGSERTITICNNRMLYIRRYGHEMKEYAVTQYFDDMPVRKLTNGDYDGIVGYRGNLYFAVLDENGKWDRRVMIGWYAGLSDIATKKSLPYVNVNNAVFEEFISLGDYLHINDEPEPVIFQRFVTIFARFKQLKIYMLGNTLSRMCPYFAEWGITKDVLEMHPNEIRGYEWHTGDMDEETGEEIVIKIALEYADQGSQKSAMAFGHARKSISGTEWATTYAAPHFPKDVNAEKIYEMCLEYQVFNFCIQFFVDVDTGGKFIYVYPLTKNRHIKRVLTEKFSTNPLTTKYCDVTIEIEKELRETFNKGNKVCYSDGLTAKEFHEALKMRGGL